MFRTKEEINEYLNFIGVFILRERGGSFLVLKRGDNPRSNMNLTPEQEKQISDAIINNTINPFIEFPNRKIRKYCSTVDLDIIDNYLREQKPIDAIQRLREKFNNAEYIHCIDNDEYYKTKNDIGEIGLFLIDSSLIPANKDILEVTERFKLVKQAISFNGVVNEFDEAYRKQMEVFDKISVCKLER